MQNSKQPQTKNSPNDITKFKEDDMSPKGTTKHVVETDWPTQEAEPVKKKRQIKKMQNARLP